MLNNEGFTWGLPARHCMRTLRHRQANIYRNHLYCTVYADWHFHQPLTYLLKTYTALLRARNSLLTSILVIYLFYFLGSELMKKMCGFGSLGSLFTMLTKLLRRNETSKVDELKKKRIQEF